MKFFNIIFIIIIFFVSFSIFSKEKTIIELHENVESIESEENTSDLLFSNESETQVIDENILNENSEDEETQVIDENILNENSEDNENNNSDNIIITDEIENVQVSEENSLVLSLPDYWEESKKDDLEFLFENINSSSSKNSKIITSFFIDILSEFSKPPKFYTEAEFNFLRITTLVKMDHREKALRVLNNINTYESNKNYYDRLKLDYYLTINDLSEACNFKDSMQETLNDNNNIILKISIFCSLIQNKIDEAELLNSLLLDAQDKDEFFQKIYFNLKNEINNPIDFTKVYFDESSFALYSAMLRIGNLPFSKQFLDFDSSNLSLPIILSPSTDISLRLKSAHIAYDLGIFNAESLSALYQSVDFTSEELNNTIKTLANFSDNPEMGMALLFQSARVQLLPITRLVSLKEFWNYAISNNFEKLAYDVSRNLIESTEPSVELSDYSLYLSRANIFNKNFEQAKKWISFAENYIQQSDDFNAEKLNNVKFLYDLQISEDNITFLKTLEDNLIKRINSEGSLSDYTETLKTILLTILDQKNLIDKIEDEKKVFDTRIMPSKYIIDKINSSSNNNKIGELILSTLVSLNGKSWNDVHPQHLQILLNSYKNTKLDNILKNIIIEIFEESKII